MRIFRARDPQTDPALAGQAVYTPRTLALYDALVLGFSNRWLWRCPTEKLLSHYNQHISANHLDIGVGSGYFLDHCQFPAPSPRVALMDMNRDSLKYAAHRIRHLNPECYRHNILCPVEQPIQPFDSISLNYLLHCLPGSMADKAVVFSHLKSLLNPGATVFGATLLQGHVKRGWWAQRLMDFYNHKGIFCNRDDDLQTLHHTLTQQFKDVNLEVVGCAALFSAHL